MGSNRKTINQLSSMMFLTILTQLLLLIKNALVAKYFGVSINLDAFNFTNNLSTFVYSFIGAGVSTIIIPYLRDKKNSKAIDIFITTIYTLGFLILILMLCFREQLVILLSGSNNLYFIDTASKIFVFTLITGFLNSTISLIRGILEFKGKFNLQKLIVLFTTVLLVTLLWLQPSENIYLYASIVMITTFIGVVLHLFFVNKSKFEYHFNFDVSNSDYKEMIKLFLPVVLSTGVYQVSILIDTMIAARLETGSISILSYSNTIISMINLLFLGNLTSFIYPKLVKITNDKDRQRTLTEYIIFTNAVLCLIMVIFYSVGKDGISLLFERGKFSSENTNLVFVCALIYAISLPTNGIRDLIYRYFYIQKDTLTPFVNSITISIINLIVSMFLSSFIGIYGVVLGTVVASYISLGTISIRFNRKFHIHFNKRSFFVENLKVILTTILAIIISIFIRNIFTIDNIILGIIINSLMTILIFALILVLFRSKVLKVNI